MLPATALFATTICRPFCRRFLSRLLTTAFCHTALFGTAFDIALCHVLLVAAFATYLFATTLLAKSCRRCLPRVLAIALTAFCHDFSPPPLATTCGHRSSRHHLCRTLFAAAFLSRLLATALLALQGVRGYEAHPQVLQVGQPPGCSEGPGPHGNAHAVLRRAREARGVL